ncbi:uncharacterized protein FMAN_13105 [Fusarium mangiferae]|uniref:Uncharacterized protein n=1 Tax=Fusarium mangiferae TaxID=192010 RepID=A0A1L7TA18_FUSMA|nr:uncharacterized protein FMAN_13105 [Fusarium mangiferae]CVK94779.1 uncharacterized protein FMAN_13105 [Fusarium mangiferae]
MERELTLRAIRQALNTSETADTECKRIADLADGRYERFNENNEAEVQSFHTDSGSIREFFQDYFTEVAELISLRSTEGILGGGLDAKLIDADGEIIRAWADLLFKEYSEKEEYLGCADHLLAVLRKK